MDSPLKKSPIELRTLFEQAGLGLTKKYSNVMDYEIDPELTIEAGNTGGDDLNLILVVDRYILTLLLEQLHLQWIWKCITQ